MSGDNVNTAIRIIIPISATLGILGAMISILGFLIFKHLRTTVARLIFCMAIADFVAILAKAIGRGGPNLGDSSWLCQTQATLMQWGDLSSIFWTVTISLNLLFIMCFKKAVDDVKRYEKWYICVCFLVPIPLSLAPLFMGPSSTGGGLNSIYGDSNLWCWIRSEHNAERIALFYAPLWLIFVFNATTYLIVGRIIWNMASKVVGNEAAQALNHRKYLFGKNTSLYLLAFLITWTPSTLARIIQFFDPNNVNSVFSIMMAIFSPARGFTNFLVYFYLSWYVQVRENKRDHESSEVETGTSYDDEAYQMDAISMEDVSSDLFTGLGIGTSANSSKISDHPTNNSSINEKTQFHYGVWHTARLVPSRAGDVQLPAVVHVVPKRVNKSNDSLRELKRYHSLRSADSLKRGSERVTFSIVNKALPPEPPSSRNLKKSDDFFDSKYSSNSRTINPSTNPALLHADGGSFDGSYPSPKISIYTNTDNSSPNITSPTFSKKDGILSYDEREFLSNLEQTHGDKLVKILNGEIKEREGGGSGPCKRRERGIIL